MADLNTTNFHVETLGETLIVRRKPWSTVLWTSVLVLSLCLLLIIPCIDIFIYHYHVVMAIWFACMWILVFSAFTVPLLPTLIKRSLPKTIVFDKGRNRIVMNDQLFCSLAELNSVNVNQSGTQDKNRLFGLYTLYLETSGGEWLMIDEAGGIGPSLLELEEVGQAVADFTGIRTHII